MTVTEILPDDLALRTVRRERVLAEMAAADIDVLLLGREANARYVSGARRLWNAGSHAFAPGCVIVRDTREIHFLSTWDEGVPDDIPRENLYGITFNPLNLVDVLRAIDGAAAARRVGTDALSPLFAQLLPTAFPAAELVDGEQAMRRARKVKSNEEVEAIRAAIHVAEAALETAVAELRPGLTERQLTGVFMEAMASHGVTTPATQDVVWITSREHPWRRAQADQRVRPGDLVAFDAGVILGGYVGELGRTYVAGGDGAGDPSVGLFQKWDELRASLLEACRAGAPTIDLLEAYDAVGVARPPMPVAHGLGLGFDLPLVTSDLAQTAAEERLEPGMVMAVTAYAWEQGLGAVFGQEPVLITHDGPELLATRPFRI